MTRAVQEVVAEQGPDILHDGRVAGGMESVASVVDADAIDVETGRVSPDHRLLLEDGDPSPVQPAQLAGGANAGRAGSEDDNVWFRHASVQREW